MHIGFFPNSSDPQIINNAKIGTLETGYYGGSFKCENSFFELVTADYFTFYSTYECSNTFTFNFCEIEKISLAYASAECDLSNTNVMHLEVYPEQTFTISENSKIDKITIPLNLNDNYNGYGEYVTFEDAETIITIKSGCTANISTATRDNEYITLNIEAGATVTYFNQE